MDVGWITRFPQSSLGVGHRQRTALSFEEEEHLTYDGMFRRQSKLANGLLSLGVGPGDRVGILMRNCVEYVCLYFAAARIGAVAVRLNFRLTAPELEFALADSGCAVLCLQPEFVQRIEQVAARTAVRTFVLFGERPETDGLEVIEAGQLGREDDSDPDVPLPKGDDPVMLMYTSGTTGFPKAAVWTHDTAIGCASSQALEFEFTRDTVAMTTGPLYHAAALEVLLLPALLCHGRGVVIASGDFSVRRTLEIAQANGVTDLMVFPFMVYEMLRLDDFTAELLPSLRRILTGGDPITPQAIEQIARRFPGAEIVQGYGLTEATQATCLPAREALRHPDSVGRPFPLKEVNVVDESDRPVVGDEVGEILIRGLGVVREYWQRPEESAAAFVDGGWLRTGDLGRIRDGLLFIVGRKKDMIRSGGENISPAEVEAALMAHADVLDAAVVAVSDNRYREVGCAVVVLVDAVEFDQDVLRAHCRERLAGYKCPRHFVQVAALPRNASGKVLKAQLRDAYREIGGGIA
jgi:fatty-acyl-CoA synthase